MVPPCSDSKAVDVPPLADSNRRSTATVRYLDAGAGDPVVLLHGIGLDAANISWKHAIPSIAEDHRVIAPDLPGHGESDKPRITYTTEYYIETLAAFLDELDLDSVTLAGISMGGCIALGYALQNQAQVDRLALVDSYGLGSDAPWRPMAAMGLRIPTASQFLWNSMGVNKGTVRDTLRGYMTRASPEFVDEVHEILQDPANGRTLRSWQRDEFRSCGFKTCYVDALSELSVPTLLVHGAEDTLLPPSWSKRAAEKLPESELHVLPECGHWPPRERPERFNDVVGDFLATSA